MMTKGWEKSVFPILSLEFMSNSFWKGRQYLINSALFICYDEEKYADEVKENEKTTSKKCSTNRKCK